jgi:hypothetical protein
MNFVVRSSSGQNVAAVLYGVGAGDRPLSFLVGAGSPVAVGQWNLNEPQLFELLFDLNAKTVTLRVNGLTIDAVRNVPLGIAAPSLSRLTMDFGGTSAYSMAWDDIEILPANIAFPR